MGYYIHTVIAYVIGNTIRKAVVTVMLGNYIHRVIVIEGSLFSREYGTTSLHLNHCNCSSQYRGSLVKEETIIIRKG